MKPKLVLYNSEVGILWFADKAEGFQLPESMQYMYKGKLITEGVNVTFSNGKTMAYRLKYPLTVKNFDECVRFKHLTEEFDLINKNFEIIRTKKTNSLIELPIEAKGLSQKFTNVEFILDTKTKTTIFTALIS